MQTLPEFAMSQVAGGNSYYSGAATTPLAPYANLCDQWASFSAIFDQYKIDRVCWRIRAVFERANFVAGTDYVPQIYSVVDFDDAVLLPTLAQARQYANLQTNLTEAFEVSIVPHVAPAVWGGAAFNGYMNVGPQWIDSASNLVPHYGLKIAITAGAGGQTRLQTWLVSTQLTLSFRNVR